jgi:hypothetical protein
MLSLNREYTPSNATNDCQQALLFEEYLDIPVDL